MHQNFSEWLKLAAHQKLLFKIPRNLRCLFMSTKELPHFKLLAYFCQLPSEEDQELISDIACELASEFMEIQRYNIDCRESREQFLELEKLDYWLFVRAEETPND